MRHKAFYANTAWQYVLTLVKYLLPFVTLPYLTRVLEPSGYAVCAYVNAFMGFVQVVIDFGFNLSGTRRVARARGVGELNRVVGAITQARLLLCLAVGACCAAAFAAIPMLRDNLLYSSLAFVAVCGRALAPDFLFQGMERMGPITTRYLVSKGLSTALTFVLVRSFADILWVPVLDVLASAVALAWSFAAARRMFGAGVERVGLAECLRELGRSGYYCLSNVASASFTGLATLIVGVAVADAAEISYWSLALSAVAAVQSLYTPITNSLYAHMVANADFAFARKLALASIPFVTGGTVAFALLSDFFFAVFGGPAYADGAYVMRVVSPVLAFSFYGMFFGWPVLGAMGRVRQLTATTFVSALFGVAGLLVAWLVAGGTLVAFGISRVLTEAILCALRMAECWRAVRGRRDA